MSSSPLLPVTKGWTRFHTCFAPIVNTCGSNLFTTHFVQPAATSKGGNPTRGGPTRRPKPHRKGGDTCGRHNGLVFRRPCRRCSGVAMATMASFFTPNFARPQCKGEVQQHGKVHQQPWPLFTTHFARPHRHKESEGPHFSGPVLPTTCRGSCQEPAYYYPHCETKKTEEVQDENRKKEKDEHSFKLGKRKSWVNK